MVRFVGTAAPNLAPPARAARRLRNLEEIARLRWCGLSGRLRPTLVAASQKLMQRTQARTPPSPSKGSAEATAHSASERATRHSRVGTGGGGYQPGYDGLPGGGSRLPPSTAENVVRGASE